MAGCSTSMKLPPLMLVKGTCAKLEIRFFSTAVSADTYNAYRYNSY